MNSEGISLYLYNDGHNTHSVGHVPWSIIEGHGVDIYSILINADKISVPRQMLTEYEIKHTSSAVSIK